MPGLLASAVMAAMCTGTIESVDAAVPGKTRESVSSTEAQGNGPSAEPDLSPNGRYLAFSSQASDFVGDDTNGADDVFVRDRRAGTTERVSVSGTGVQGDGVSSDASLSDDGRYVAFTSEATNLVPGDTNGVPDVFVKDRTTGGVERVNVQGSGAQSVAGASGAQISGNGRYVAFLSSATDLTPDISDEVTAGFIRDLKTGTTQLVSRRSKGIAADASDVSISRSGRRVAFASYDTIEGSGGGGNNADAYVFNTSTGRTQAPLHPPPGGTGVWASWDDGVFAPEISASGKFLALVTDAWGFARGDDGENDDVYLINVDTHAISVATQDFEIEDYDWASRLAVSGDGSTVAFGLYDDGVWRHYVHDRRSGVTRHVPADSPTDGGFGIALDETGGLFALQSSRSNLVVEDTNGVADLFSWSVPPLPCTIRGTAGDDTLTGTPGNDVVCGFQGDDVLQGRGGNDLLVGGPGTDTASYVRAPGPVLADLTARTVTGQGNDRLSTIENLTGSRYGDRILPGKFSGRYRGLNGPDQIFGSYGFNRLVAGPGDDVVTLPPVAGGSLVSGGRGVDEVRFTLSSTANLGTGRANSGFIDGPGDFDLLGFENVTGSDSLDWLTGSAGNNIIRGGNGDDRLRGGRGIDRCYGGQGIDTAANCETVRGVP